VWKYTVANDTGGGPRWWLYNASNSLMAYSEAYGSTANAQRGAATFKQHAAQWRYTAFQGENSRYYWHAQAGNNEIVASGSNFATKAEAEGQMNAVRVNGGTATGP
jgi:uncharacterized protein YegP (UPF0339 family)